MPVILTNSSRETGANMDYSLKNENKTKQNPHNNNNKIPSWLARIFVFPTGMLGILFLK